MKNLDISVVILCYKGGEAVRDFISQVKKSLEERGLTYELILVANYNKGEEHTDKTPSVVKWMASKDDHLVIVSKPKEGMFGWDVKSGLNMAVGNAVTFIDGDGQMPAKDVVRVYDALIETGSDMAQTYRTKRHDSFKRTTVSFIYNLLLKTLFPRVKVLDANSKPKIFLQKALKELRLTSDDWFIDAEIVIQATEKGFSIVQIPTVFLKNSERSSFVKLSSLFEFLGNLFRYRFAR